MATSLSSCVVDTYIIIDLHRGGVLKELFRLPYTLLAPDVIVAELLEPAGKTLLDLGVQSMDFSPAISVCAASPSNTTTSKFMGPYGCWINWSNANSFPEVKPPALSAR
jgi:hypothetical protein